MSGKVDLHNDVVLPFDLLVRVSSLTRLFKVEEKRFYMQISDQNIYSVHFIVSNIEISDLMYHSFFSSIIKLFFLVCEKYF